MPCFPPHWHVLILLGSFVSLLLPTSCLAQFPSSSATNLTKLVSPYDPNVIINYKTPVNACTTAFENQEQLTGWITVPGSFPTNIFFWFVSARVPTTQLTVWLNGGPGSSSMFGFFTENGPCEIVESGVNKLETVAREWGWDRASNMIFIDQPNQVGFSYDVATNGSADMRVENYNYSVPPVSLPNGTPAAVFLNGTFSSQNVNNTANTTEVAASAVWHFLQGFLSTFPQYNPPNTTRLGVNLFTESYGGRYGPLFAQTWEEENDKAANGTNTTAVTNIHLASLGIVNGCVDDLVMGPSYVEFAVNNTYNIKLLSTVYAGLMNGSFYQTGGCQDLITQCRTAVQVSDPNNTGSVEEVNSLCRTATTTCATQRIAPYQDAGRSVYDIGHSVPDSFPPSYYLEYLNSAPIQQAIGSIVNFTDVSVPVYNAFGLTGDMERGGSIVALAGLLEKGVRVGLIYGDRDYICNWMGGEAVSLELAKTVGGSYSNFSSAGYAPIIVNTSYIGGVVRQLGNLSFSRIYQAGHFVPAYQPETAFQVFARVIMGTSLSTGGLANLHSYSSNGSSEATSTMRLPSSPAPTCFVRKIGSCSDDEKSGLLKGEGVIVNGIWYDASSDYLATLTSSSAKTSSMAASQTQTLTGLFTATSTPKSDGSSSPRIHKHIMLIILLVVNIFTHI